MSAAFWIWSHLAFTLLFASVFSLLVKRRGSVVSIVLCLVIPGVLGVLPAGQTDVSGFAMAHTGAFSASMLVLLTFQLLANLGFVEPWGTSTLRTMNLFWLILGMILYPSALGFLSRDMYLFGFHLSMNWCVLAFSAVAVFRRYRILGLCLAFSVLAHLLNLHESRNLWDYLIDPWLWIASLVSLLAGMCGSLVQRERSSDQSPATAGHTIESHS